jgi:hypothetical protein
MSSGRSPEQCGDPKNKILLCLLTSSQIWLTPLVDDGKVHLLDKSSVKYKIRKFSFYKIEKFLPSTKLGIVGLLSFHTIHEIH